MQIVNNEEAWLVMVILEQCEDFDCKGWVRLVRDLVKDMIDLT